MSATIFLGVSHFATLGGQGRNGTKQENQPPFADTTFSKYFPLIFGILGFPLVGVEVGSTQERHIFLDANIGTAADAMPRRGCLRQMTRGRNYGSVQSRAACMIRHNT